MIDESKVVVRRQEQLFSTADRDVCGLRRVDLVHLAAKMARLFRRQLFGEHFLHALRTHIPRRTVRHAAHEHALLFQIANRVGDAVARTAIEEDASAVGRSRLLELRDAAIAKRRRRHIARHIVGIVGHADLRDDVRRMDDLRRENDGFGEVVFAVGRPFCSTFGVHVRRTQAAFGVRLQAFERVRIEQHCAAHPIRLGKLRQDGFAVLQTKVFQGVDNHAPPLGRRLNLDRRDGKRGQMLHRLGRDRLHLEVHEIRLALGVVQGARKKRRQMFRQFLLRQDFLRARHVLALPRVLFRPHFQTVKRHAETLLPSKIFL